VDSKHATAAAHRSKPNGEKNGTAHRVQWGGGKRSQELFSSRVYRRDPKTQACLLLRSDRASILRLVRDILTCTPQSVAMRPEVSNERPIEV